MMDVLDPEAPEPRSQWDPMINGQCFNCGAPKRDHIPGKNLELYCPETFLRMQDGDR